MKPKTGGQAKILNSIQLRVWGDDDKGGPSRAMLDEVCMLLASTHGPAILVALITHGKALFRHRDGKPPRKRK